MATVKVGVAMPQNPGCPNVEDNSFPQNVNVNLSILNQSRNSRKSSDYYNRSTSPWNLQYVRVPEKPVYSCTSECHLPHFEGDLISWRLIRQGILCRARILKLSFYRFNRAQNTSFPIGTPVLLDIIVTNTKIASQLMIVIILGFMRSQDYS